MISSWVTIVFLVVGSMIDITQSCAGFGGSGGGANGQIGMNEVTNTPRFVLSVSPPLSWTAPSNNAPWYTVPAAASQVAITLLNAQNNLNDSNKAAQRAVQFAFESSIRQVVPGYGSQIIFDLSNVNGVQVNAYTYPIVISSTSNSTGTPAGAVQLNAVTKLCSQPCTIAAAAGGRKKRDLGNDEDLLDNSNSNATSFGTKQEKKMLFDIRVHKSHIRVARQAVTCAAPIPAEYAGCSTDNEFSPFVVQQTVRITDGPLLSGQQWYQVANQVYMALNQNENVFFNQEIQVYAS